MPKAKNDPYCISSLAKEISRQWSSTGEVSGPGRAPAILPADGFEIIAGLLCPQVLERLPAIAGAACRPGLSQGAGVRPAAPPVKPEAEKHYRFFTDQLRHDLLLGAEQFILEHKQRLLRQGIVRFSDAGLLAFFFSALYEEVRYQTPSSAFAPGEEGIGSNPAKRRGRIKRRGAAYFSPPALAYLAAHRALSAYFDGSAKVYDKDCDDGRQGLPLVCDPAMGTGLYLVAALDYLSIERPLVSRLSLVEKCLAGMDLDAITCGAAKNCLALAAQVGMADTDGLARVGANLLWVDSLQAKLSEVDVVISNPPWDIVKSGKNQDSGLVPRRVNKARTAALRRGFLYQGEGDTSYYKLFLERSYNMLKPGGVASVLTPASLCGDKGAAPLRKLLLEYCRWISLDGFINEDNAFAIHPHFRYVLTTFKKDAPGENIKARFGLLAGSSKLIDSSGDDANVSSSSSILYDRSLVELLGGPARVIIELDGGADLDLSKTLYGSHRSLADFTSGRGYFFKREFDMTLDRPLFRSPNRAAQLAASGEEWLPLFEGRMVGQFQPHKNSSPPRYFVQASEYRRRVGRPAARVGFVSISSPFNTRSMVAAYLPDRPAGNSLPTLVFGADAGPPLTAVEDALFTTAVFNSFIFDWLVRMRLSGNNLSYHLLENLPFPDPARAQAPLTDLIVALSAVLSFEQGDFKSASFALEQKPGSCLSKIKCALRSQQKNQCPPNTEDFLALDTSHRLRLRIWLELLVFELYGLDSAEVSYILRDCDLPEALLSRRRRYQQGAFSRAGTDRGRFAEPGQRGFFRVDKAFAPHLRMSNLVKQSFVAGETSGACLSSTLFVCLCSAQPSLALPAEVERNISERANLFN